MTYLISITTEKIDSNNNRHMNKNINEKCQNDMFLARKRRYNLKNVIIIMNYNNSKYSFY